MSQLAEMKGLVDQRTPSLIVNESRGLPVRQVAYLRTVEGGPVETLISRQRHDAAGRLAEQWDPRLFASAPQPNFATVYNLTGEPLKVDSVDAGWRLSLPGLAGEEVQQWDARGSHWRTTYDNQLRVVAVEENAMRDVDTYTYANASANSSHNLRGQMIALKDPSSTVSFHSYALLGHPLRETRTFHDGKAFVSHRTFSPLGTVFEQIDSGGHRQQSSYDLAGNLTQVQLQLSGRTDWQSVLEDAKYNATGQIVEQRTGNGMTTRWIYDLTDGRLLQQTAQKNQASVLQDFEYQYDRVGNITRILDLTFTPAFFANQRVDGHRDFTYDSLYRLISASGYDDGPPSDTPGRPQPTDPNDRRNYTQTYQYDHGGNLIKLSHVREGANDTRQMFIDPVSNRGVRWAEGDTDPQFDKLFDPHGNLQALPPGQGMQWNARDQLELVTLVDRGGSDPDDAEHYSYSQGARVFKRQETHTTKTNHFHEVRYLPGLEIRTRDNGEELHVISLAAGFGSVRCLHWVTGKPAGIDNDQLRFTLDDHLGSCLMELDQQAQLISHEGYYPFGATAWMAVRSQIEVAYKFIRYSGKEMDVSGLYYYGARYYAPWLQRWVSADPAGDVDGLNLYAFVGNDPIGHVDVNGEVKLGIKDGLRRIIASENASYAKNRQDRATLRSKNQMSNQVTRHIDILGLTKRRAQDAAAQLDRMGSGSDIALATMRRSMVLVVGKGISYGVGIAVGIGAQSLGAVAPGVGNVIGVGLGIGVKVAVGGLVDYVAERTGLSSPVNLKTSKLTAHKIIQKAEYKQMEPGEYLIAKYRNMKPNSQKTQLKLSKEATTQASGFILKATLTSMPSEAVSAISSGVAVLVGLPEIVDETLGALSDKSAEKMLEFERQILGLADAIESSQATIHEFADAISVTSIGSIDIQDLDQQTGKITSMLHGLANTVRTHRASQNAAA